MATYTKKEAIRVVVDCANKYEKELADKDFLLICNDKHKRTSCIELTFFRRNFLHLTGFKLNNRFFSESMKSHFQQDIISAEDFYARCLYSKLGIDDFDFAADGTTCMKLDVLPFVITKNLSANMIGDYNLSKPTLYTEKITGSVKACIGFVVDNQTNRFVPNTILKDDIKTVVTGYARVIAVFRKNIDERFYNEITYVAKGIKLIEIDFPYEYMYLHHNIIAGGE